MIHYHGGPITPDPAAIKAWSAGHAFISYAHPVQINLAMEICQSFALDNGAFSFWKSNRAIDWLGYYEWCRQMLNHPRFDFAVIPDVIEGSESDNDALLEQWPFGTTKGAAVWHINESIDRLVRLSRLYRVVCIGSSGDYDVKNVKKCLARLRVAIAAICDDSGKPLCKLHGLRMLNPAIFTNVPLSSADSTNIAINIGRDVNWRGTYVPKSKPTRALILRERVESHTSSCRNAITLRDVRMIREFAPMFTIDKLAEMFNVDNLTVEECLL